MVDVVVAEVLDLRERCREAVQVCVIGAECGAFCDQESWFGVEGAFKRYPTAGLVFRVGQTVREPLLDYGAVNVP